MPIQLRSQPAYKQDRGRSEPWRKIDPRLADLGEAMVRSGMIEELREREAKVVQPRPIQVAKHDTLVGLLLHQLEKTCLRAKIAPATSAIDHAIDPRPKLWIHRFAKFFLPPKTTRQIRIQIGKDDARQLYGAPAFEQE